MKWSRNQKISLFIVTYHIPYTPRNRYWTGLLLLVRAVLYIGSTANVSGDPSFNLLIIGTGIVGILLLMKFVSAFSPVYKKWPVEYVEVICYVNLILLCMASFFSRDNETKAIVTNISVSVTFILFMCVLLYHIFSELTCPRLMGRKQQRGNRPQEIQTSQLEKSEVTSTTILGPVKGNDTDYSIELREALLDEDCESKPTY